VCSSQQQTAGKGGEGRGGGEPERGQLTAADCSWGPHARLDVCLKHEEMGCRAVCSCLGSGTGCVMRAQPVEVRLQQETTICSGRTGVWCLARAAAWGLEGHGVL
jgi:hypothetical protein